MDTVKHSLGNSFLQLGLSANDGDIENFIKTHPLYDGQIGFWAKYQAQFIKESRDADCLEMVDELDTMLRVKR